MSKSDTTNTEASGIDNDDLPIYTHEYILGADVGVAQRDTIRHEYNGYRKRESAVQVDPYQGKSQAQRRYLAAWARRSLFSRGDADE